MDRNIIVHEKSTRLFQRQWKGFFLNVSVAKQDLEDHLRNRIISVVKASIYFKFYKTDTDET